MGEIRTGKATMTEPGQKCSHGIAWQDECHECDVVWAREVLRHWQKPVAEAQRVVEEVERVKTQ